MGEYATETAPDPFAQQSIDPNASTAPAYPDDGMVYGPRVQYDDGTPIVDPPTAADIANAHGHYTEYIGPHAYETTGPDGQLSQGAGLVHSESPDGKVDFMTVTSHTNPNGGGGDLNVQALKFDVPVGNNGMGMDGGLLDAGITLVATDDETAFGGGANVADAAVTVGTTQNNARVGASYGVGLAGRFHHAKDPNTYKRSYGVGADIGPISFDVRTDALSDPELNETPEAQMVNPADAEAEEAPGARFYVPVSAYAPPAK